MGIPHRLVLGEKGLDQGFIEYKGRRDSETTHIPLDTLFDFLAQTIKK